MLLDNPLALLSLTLLLFALATLVKPLLSPLRSLPGPLIARFTRLWYAHTLSLGAFEKRNLNLHTSHGKIVRLALNEYSISDPSALKVIYHSRPEFRKADFYSAWEPPHLPNIFSGRDVRVHKEERRKLAGAYSMSVMTSYEKYVDDCVEILCRRLREREEVDMAWWLQCFAFDVIGEITYSRRFGFLDAGEDQNGLIANVHGNNRYSLFMGLFSEWHEFCFRMIGWLGKMGIGKGSEKDFLINHTLRKKEEREREMDDGKEKGEDIPKDFMTNFLEQHRKDASRFSVNDILNGVGGNINAGSDTTGITLSVIMYHLLANPHTLERLRKEIEEHGASDPITFKEAQSLDYLQAVIKEGLRIHPPVGIPLARVVPPEGALIAGQFFPGGTVVGMNPYVLHHDPDVYGADVEAFRPERWLKSETDPETLARMEHSWCPFGMGSRMCLGKNVSLLEISKLVPQLVRGFDFEMSDNLRREGLRTRNEFFVLIENLRLKVRER